MADAARLEALSAEVLARSEKEQARLASALQRFKYNTGLFSLLVVVWLLRSVESLGPAALVGAVLAVGGLLVGLHVHEAKSLVEARQTADELHKRVGRVAQQVSDLLERRERQKELELQQQQEDLDALSVASGSTTGTTQSRTYGSPSPPQLPLTSPVNSVDGPRSVRSFGGWSLRSDRSDASNVSELPHAESTRSAAVRKKPKRRGFVRRVLGRRRTRSSASESARHGSQDRIPHAELEASSVAEIQDESMETEAALATARDFQKDADDEAVGDEAAGPGYSGGQVATDFKVTDEVEIPTEDILQPPTSEGIEALRARVADVTSPALERTYGGPIRLYERYLFARNEKLSAAEKMFRETIKFREERGMEDPKSEQTKKRLASFAKLKPHWPGQFLDQTSGDGSPIQIFRYGELRPKELMKQVTEEEFADFYVTWMEMTLEMQNRSNSRQYQARCRKLRQEGEGAPEGSEADNAKDPDAPHAWKSFIELHDLSGLSFSQLHPPGIAMLTRVLKVGQGHYPENLRAAFIVNAPFLFSGAWKVISKVLDPATVEKINVSSNIPREKLAKYMEPSVIDEIFPPRT